MGEAYIQSMDTPTAPTRPLSFTEAGTGASLVLVHGFPLDSRMWEAQVRGLSDMARVITPDLRGFGHSPSDDRFTMESQADDLHHLLSEIGALPCTMAGLSMGGYVALAYVRKYPTDLRALALIDTRAEGDSPEGRTGREKMIELVRRSGAEAVVDEMMGKLIAEETVCHRPQVAFSLRKIMQSCSPHAIEHALAAMRDRDDQTSNLASIPVPTLLIVGDCDVITPTSSAELMLSQIPHARLETIGSSGHMSPMEQPAQVTEALRRFLMELAQRGH